MEKEILTVGNRCFVGKDFVGPVRDVRAATVVMRERVKPEKVNLKFGKIRVNVTSAKKVRVKEEENALVIFLE